MISLFRRTTSCDYPQSPADVPRSTDVLQVPNMLRVCVHQAPVPLRGLYSAASQVLLAGPGMPGLTPASASLVSQVRNDPA